MIAQTAFASAFAPFSSAKMLVAMEITHSWTRIPYILPIQFIVFFRLPAMLKYQRVYLLYEFDPCHQYHPIRNVISAKQMSLRSYSLHLLLFC